MPKFVLTAFAVAAVVFVCQAVGQTIDRAKRLSWRQDHAEAMQPAVSISPIRYHTGAKISFVVPSSIFESAMRELGNLCASENFIASGS